MFEVDLGNNLVIIAKSGHDAEDPLPQECGWRPVRQAAARFRGSLGWRG
jgi:hypothetical protein